MKHKIATSIKQSEKLIELGIDVRTADMYYWCSEDLRIGGYKAQCAGLDTPAWSLSALLDLIPRNEETLFDVCSGGWDVEKNVYVDEWFASIENHVADLRKDISSESAIDAVFEMIVWLKENGKL